MEDWKKEVADKTELTGIFKEPIKTKIMKYQLRTIAHSALFSGKEFETSKEAFEYFNSIKTKVLVRDIYADRIRK